MKTWTPDTCPAPGCKVEEVYDGDAIIGMGAVLRKCAAHADVPDEDLYGVLYANPDGENKRKNKVLRILLGHEEIKDLGLEERKQNPDGSDAGFGLKAGIEYIWSFTGAGADRILQVEVKGATLVKAKKDSIVALCDTKFGSGKVNLL